MATVFCLAKSLVVYVWCFRWAKKNDRHCIQYYSSTCTAIYVIFSVVLLSSFNWNSCARFCYWGEKSGTVLIIVCDNCRRAPPSPPPPSRILVFNPPFLVHSLPDLALREPPGHRLTWPPRGCEIYMKCSEVVAIPCRSQLLFDCLMIAPTTDRPANDWGCLPISPLVVIWWESRTGNTCIVRNYIYYYMYVCAGTHECTNRTVLI